MEKLTVGSGGGFDLTKYTFDGKVNIYPFVFFMTYYSLYVGTFFFIKIILGLMFIPINLIFKPYYTIKIHIVDIVIVFLACFHLLEFILGA